MLPIYLCTSIHATLNFKKLTFWELIFRELTFWEVDILGVDISGVDILGVDILRLTLRRHREHLRNLVTCSDVRRIRRKTHGSHCLE